MVRGEHSVTERFPATCDLYHSSQRSASQTGAERVYWNLGMIGQDRHLRPRFGRLPGVEWRRIRVRGRGVDASVAPGERITARCTSLNKHRPVRAD